ncbi:MAG: DUF4019 domain-containing protein [Syntrophotaleaceae bacterium]
MIPRIACLLTALSTILLLVSLAAAQNNQAARDAAMQWVKLIDEGNYAESWEKAAPAFKESISKEEWVKSLEAVRKPLGQVQSRNLRSSAETTSLPDAPEGEYLVMEFDTSYQNNPSAIETITATQIDGNWRIAGYYIR